MYKFIDDALCAELSHAATSAARKRVHHNFHEDLSEPVQRLCIALDQASYVRPHAHPDAHKWEMTLVIRGQLRLLIFDEQGTLRDAFELSEQGPIKGMEIPPGTWHSLVASSPQAVILEIKQGPYSSLESGNFASWAPEEHTAEVATFLSWCRVAQVGEPYPG